MNDETDIILFIFNELLDTVMTRFFCSFEITLNKKRFIPDKAMNKNYNWILSAEQKYYKAIRYFCFGGGIFYWLFNRKTLVYFEVKKAFIEILQNYGFIYPLSKNKKGKTK